MSGSSGRLRKTAWVGALCAALAMAGAPVAWSGVEDPGGGGSQYDKPVIKGRVVYDSTHSVLAFSGKCKLPKMKGTEKPPPVAVDFVADVDLGDAASIESTNDLEGLPVLGAGVLMGQLGCPGPSENLVVVSVRDLYLWPDAAILTADITLMFLVPGE